MAAVSGGSSDARLAKTTTIWLLCRWKALIVFLTSADVFQDEDNDDFLSISRAMEEIVDDPVDCYWLIKCFVNQFHAKFGDSVPHLVSPPPQEVLVTFTRLLPCVTLLCAPSQRAWSTT